MNFLCTYNGEHVVFSKHNIEDRDQIIAVSDNTIPGQNGVDTVVLAVVNICVVTCNVETWVVIREVDIYCSGVDLVVDDCVDWEDGCVDGGVDCSVD